MFMKNRRRFRFSIRSSGSNEDDNLNEYYMNNSNSTSASNNNNSDPSSPLHFSGNNMNHTQGHSNSELASFDACVGYCDALAASSASIVYNENLLNGNDGDDNIDRKGVTKSNAGNDSCPPSGDLDGSHQESKIEDITQNISAHENNEKYMKEKVIVQLSDCSVRVSPDGELMVLPVEVNEKSNDRGISTSSLLDISDDKKDEDENEDSNDEEGDDESDPLVDDDYSDEQTNSKEAESESKMQVNDELFSLAHVSHTEFQSAVIVGNDQPGGDRAANGFSANGWSSEAAGMTFRQSSVALQLTSEFLERILLSRKEESNNISNACKSIYAAIIEAPKENSIKPLSPPILPSGPSMIRKFISNQSNHSSTNTWDKDTVSPGLGFNESFPSLYSALVAMEHYHTATAEADSERWKKASQFLSGKSYHQQHLFHHQDDINHPTNIRRGISCLPKLQNAAQKTAQRAVKRESALRRATKIAYEAEQKLKALKAEARYRWSAVRDAEELSRERINETIQERMDQNAREREKRRMGNERGINEDEDALKASGHVSAIGSTISAPTPTQEEIWELVSQVTDSFDQGSFAPTFTLPNSTPTIQDESKDLEAESKTPFNSITPMEQMQIEYDCNVPRLRNAAKMADEAVEDAVGALLNALSNLDTTNRSARIALETGLLSAANAQADCLRSLVELEKASLNERLRELENFEDKVNLIDVRSDLCHCIDEEKKKYHSSSIREDDDGGVASALAVLNCHRESVGGMPALENQIGNVVLEGWGATDETGVVSREEIEDMIQFLFVRDPNTITEPTVKQLKGTVDSDMPQDLQGIVKFVVGAVEGHSKMCCIHRAMVCAALNKQRSIQTEMKYKENFDGLCIILNALLSGCDRQTEDIDNAKMCMILAQTFYRLDKSDTKTSDENSNTEAELEVKKGSREDRIYIKDELKAHPIWSDEHFWDQALFQCISDALTKTGVLRSFQMQGHDKTIEWHDLNSSERVEAATQLHAVICAQLDALAHSMVEFGCEIEFACAFVRRMSIRHQLPISKRSLLLQHLMGPMSKNHSLKDNSSEERVIK